MYMLPKPSKARLHILCRMQGSCGSFLRRRVLLSAGHTTAQLRQLGRMPGSAVRCGCSILYLSEHHMPEAYMLKTAMHWFNRRGREWVCPSALLPHKQVLSKSSYCPCKLHRSGFAQGESTALDGSSGVCMLDLQPHGGA